MYSLECELRPYSVSCIKASALKSSVIVQAASGEKKEIRTSDLSGLVLSLAKASEQDGQSSPDEINQKDPDF